MSSSSGSTKKTHGHGHTNPSRDSRRGDRGRPPRAYTLLALSLGGAAGALFLVVLVALAGPGCFFEVGELVVPQDGATDSPVRLPDTSVDSALQDRLVSDVVLGDATDACAADLSSDPQNCGVCGRSCGTFRCISGGCEVTNVGTPFAEDVQHLAIDPNYVYAATNSAVYLIPKDGGATQLVTNVGASAILPLDDGRTMLVAQTGTDASVLQVPLPIDPPATPQVIATGQRSIGGLASNPSFFYWSSTDGIMRQPRTAVDGGAPVALLRENAAALANDGTRLYWTTPGFSRVRLCDPTLCSSTVQTISTGGNAPTHLAAFSGTVYYTGLATAGLFGCRLPSCSPPPDRSTAIASGIADIFVDASGLVWLPQANSEPVGACTPATTCATRRSLSRALVTGTSTRVVADLESVFFAVQNRIYAVPR